MDAAWRPRCQFDSVPGGGMAGGGRLQVTSYELQDGNLRRISSARGLRAVASSLPGPGLAWTLEGMGETKTWLGNYLEQKIVWAGKYVENLICAGSARPRPNGSGH